MRATRAAVIAAVLSSAVLTAQQPSAPVALTLDQIENPSTEMWPTYNGDYSGRRFSPLTKIDANNVAGLSLAWVRSHGV